MAHCIGEYASCCRHGCCRIYSVRDGLTRDRLATLSLHAKDGQWTLTQLKADRNAEPPGAVTLATEAFAKQVREHGWAPRVPESECTVCDAAPVILQDVVDEDDIF